MRVLVVGPVPPELGSRNPGGVARQVWLLARALRHGGDEVDLLVTGRYARGTRTVDGVRLIAPSLTAAALCRGVALAMRGLARRPGGGPRSALHMLSTAVRLSVAGGRDYDVVHVHTLYSHGALLSRLAGVGRAVVATVHSHSGLARAGAAERTRLLRRVNRALADVDHVIHVSAADRAAALALGVRWPGGDSVVRNAVEPSDPSLGWPDSADRSGVAYVGQLSASKGVVRLLDAWARLGADAPGRLRIVGTGPLEGHVRARAAALPGVEALGYRSPAEVRRILRRSLALAVPSETESFGLVYVEALLEGAAALGYRPAVEEFRRLLECTPAEAGLLAPHDAADGADALARWIATLVDRRREPAGEAAARSMAAKAARAFGVDRLVAGARAAYAAALAGPRSGSAAGVADLAGGGAG